MLAVNAMSHGAAAILLFVALVAFAVGFVLSLVPGPPRDWRWALLFLGLAMVDLWWFWDELARS